MNGAGTGIAFSDMEFVPDRSDRVALLLKTGEMTWPELVGLGTKHIMPKEVPPEACINMEIIRPKGSLLTSKVGILLLSIFLSFMVLSSIMFAFVWVAVSTQYVVMDPYLMLFGCLGSVGLTLTAWRAIRRTNLL